MKRMSPPTGVQARPVATPGSAVRSATSDMNFCGPRYSGTSSALTTNFSFEPSATLTATPRHDRADLALEVAHAGLARVAVDDLGDRVVGDLDLLVLEAVLLELLGHEELARDVALLVARVARQLEDLETILERRRHRVDHVRRREEHHVRQIERHLEVVIGEACCSARGRAPRAAPTRGRPGSRARACRSRRA